MPTTVRLQAAASSTCYCPGDVLLAPLSFSDLSGDKVRPAVIVSCDAYNRSGDLIVAHLTSNTAARRHISDYLLQDSGQAGLEKASVVQGKLSTISASLITKKIGRLSPRDFRAIGQVVLNETFYLIAG